MNGDAIAAAAFLIIGVLLVLIPQRMLRLNAYIMLSGRAPDEDDMPEQNLVVTRAIGVVFLLVGGVILY